jgi:hypothetical protein
MDKPWCYSQTETATRNPLEPPADISVKGGREVDYGHKLNLTTGRSGLILDLVIEAGNPADSERFSCELSGFRVGPNPATARLTEMAEQPTPSTTRSSANPPIKHTFMDAH